MSIKKEIQRKAIHQLSLAIPITYIYTDKEFVLTCLIPIAILVVIVDFARIYITPIRTLFNKLFSHLTRSHESNHLTGSSYFLAATVLVIAYFPKNIVLLGLFILIISDTAAALVGKSIGRHNILGKSWEGSGAFFLTAFIIGIVMPEITIFEAAIYGFVSMLIELLPIPIDDNFRIPVGVCLLSLVI